MSGSLTAARLLDAWEATLDEPASTRGVALLAGCRALVRDDVARWPVTARDAALFDLRIELFGSAADAVVSCPHCGERLDVALDLDGLRPPPRRLESADAEIAGMVAGHAVVARVPSTEDLVAVGAVVDEASASGALLRRCLTSLDLGDGTLLDPADLTDELERAVRAWMAEQLDPNDVVLSMTCSACEQPIEAPFDIAAFVVADVDTWAEHTLCEVHALATAYGWAETDVLALSACRRARYLALIDGAEDRWPTR